jgi:hypothetical protein
MSTAAAAPPASPDEALAMLTTAMSYLADADVTQLPAEVLAEVLRTLERVDAVETAARTRVLGAFTAARGYCEDGDYSPRSWLMHKTRITRAAAAHTAWVRRAEAHPRFLAAMAGEQMSEPYARTLAGWTGKFPQECRDAADEILAAAAAAGMDLRDLAALAAEMLARACPPDDDDGPGPDFEDRGVRLETTFEGAGVLSGDLTPECAALVGTVLDALSAPRGAEDQRTQAQRSHDALQEAMYRLVAAGLLPARAGQAARVTAHISLADLIVLDADSALQEQWTEGVRAQWAGLRAAVSVGGGDGGAWLEGDAAEGFACDAAIVPVVFGEVNDAVLDELVGLCVQLAAYRHGTTTSIPSDAASDASASSAASDSSSSSPAFAFAGFGDGGPDAWPAAVPGTAQVTHIPAGLMSRESLERAIIGKAVALLSGPAGLAGFLRRGLLGARLGGPSLPLNVGYSETIPSAIRHAVIVRTGSASGRAAVTSLRRPVRCIICGACVTVAKLVPIIAC